MEAADYGKMVKWMLNEGYGNGSLMPELNKVFASGSDSIQAIRSMKEMPPPVNLYGLLKDFGKFKENAVSEEVFNKNIFDAFKRAGGDTYMLGNISGGYRKSKTAKRTYKKKTKKVNRKSSKKTRKY